jgi:hypothetical protein
VKFIKLLTLVILLFPIYLANGMQKEIVLPYPLSDIERLIVRNKIDKIGKDTILDMIHTPRNSSDTHNEFTQLPTVTKIRKNKTDCLSLSIIDAIQEQEKKHKYIPEQISEKKDGVWHITIPTNYFGNYTRYWHKKDSKGEYIELHSSFTYKPALMEVIDEY